MLRKKLKYIAVYSAFLLTACGHTEEVQKPEQELMFLITYDNYSWGKRIPHL